MPWHPKQAIIEGRMIETRTGWRIKVTRIEKDEQDFACVYGIVAHKGTGKEEYVGTLEGLSQNLKL